MGRLLLAGVLVACATSIASAGPTRKVRVETTPPGATVYIESIDNGAACEATPCTINVPIGQATLIVRLDGYQPEFELVDVTKGKKPVPVSVKLKAATGVIIIKSPKGASVRINDDDEGKVPVEVEVPAEPARVVVTMGGKTLHDDFVNVDVGAQVEVEVDGSAAVASGDEEEGDEEEDDGDGGEGDRDGDAGSGGSIEAGTTAGARAAYLQAGLALDIGFRRFVFSDGSAPFSNSGETLLGPAVELWPGRLAGVHVLRNLSLFARLQFALTHQKVTRQNNGMLEDVGAETFWGALELSLRQKWVFGGVLGVEASVGYARDQLEFNAINDTVLMQVPSADYKTVRIGARVSIAKPVEPYLSAENRIVLSGGNLATRADGAETSGYRLAAGLVTKLGPLGARVEGALGKYSWTFTDTSGAGTPNGASDKLFAISFQLGYQY